MKISGVQAQNHSTLLLKQQQISYTMKQRNKIAQEINHFINNPDKKYKDSSSSINQYAQQYRDLQQLIVIIGGASNNEKNKIGQYNKFWSLNESIEREVEEHLRNLKQMDANIDDILNQEFVLCNDIEQIQENIRNILNKKDPNNINQAQPLLSKKIKTLDVLHRCKQQKQKIKSQKLNTIVQLLKLLQKLRIHRENRLGYCKQRKLTSDSMNALTYLVKDLKNMAEQRQKAQSKQINYRKLIKSLQYTNERILNLQTQLLEQYHHQRQILQSSQIIKQQIQENKCWQHSIFQALKMQPKDLSAFLQNSTLLIQEEQQKKQQLQQIIQGINTTNQTINIFRHIQNSIQNQNKRKIQLLKTLEYLQEEHSNQTFNEEKIHDLQSQLQKIQLKKQRLLKKLSAKADQADVQAYRNINIEIQSLETQGRAKQIIIKDMKKQWSEKAKHLFLATNSINDEFNDILSEVVPQVWFRDNDFSKQQTIKDLNLYLIKTFNRLTAKE